MLSVEKIVDSFSRHGLGPYICVPCSFLKPFINYVIDSPNLQYIKATVEGEAVSIAAGLYLGGKRPIVMFQNSGLGNIINPVTSLLNIYKIPILFIVSLRGEPGIKDEPQHQIMGGITSELLTITDIANTLFPASQDAVGNSVKEAIAHMEKTLLPYAFILKKGVLGEYVIKKDEKFCLNEGIIVFENEDDIILKRMDAIKTIVESLNGDEPIVSTTGMISRELFTLSDKDNHFYTLGSMGCTSAIAFGISLCKKRRIVVLDGDGAVLMKMGNLATIGHYGTNILHIVLDNGAYDSTGGQATVSPTVNIAKVAAACGYKTASVVYSSDYLSKHISDLRDKPGPHMLNVKVKKGHDSNLGRVTITPVQIKERFKKYLEGVE